MIRLLAGRPLIILGPDECDRLNRGDRIEIGALEIELSKPDLLQHSARRRPPDPPEAREFLPEHMQRRRQR